jgi:hypothetical protein
LEEGFAEFRPDEFGLIAFVDDAVGVVPAVADNLDSEDVENCFNMIRERTRGKVAAEFIN